MVIHRQHERDKEDLTFINGLNRQRDQKFE